MPLRSDIGCVRHETIQLAEDETGQQCVYFLSHKGPYRISAGGVQYLGNDNEDDIWSVMNLDATTAVGHTCAYTDKHQVWWWIAVGAENEPQTTKMMFDTRLGKQGEGDSVIMGWAKHTGASAAARCSCLFSVTPGATMTRALKPFMGNNAANTSVFKCDTGTDDSGTTFQAYVDTKPEAPFGYGWNVSVTDPQLVAEVASGVTITVSPLSDFGLSTAQSGTALLTATGSETRAQKRIEGLQTSGAGVVGFRVGDASAISNAWTLDALLGIYHQQESRS